MTAYNTGMTGQNMIDEVLSHGNEEGTSEQNARALRWLNRASIHLFSKFDWPELIVNDAEFTTDGSTKYDLTTYLTADSIAVENFGRLRGDSIRIGTLPLDIIGKGQWDKKDPARTLSGVAVAAAMTNRKDFRILPYGSDGETVKLDFVGLPVLITAATTADEMSFYPERQILVIEYAVMWTYRHTGQGDWTWQNKLFDQHLDAEKVRASVTSSTPGRFPNKKF